MASIEEVRAMIKRANEEGNSSLGMLQQANASPETMQGSLMHAVEGSGQQDAAEAVGLVTQAIECVGDAVQRVSAAIPSAETVAARL